MTAQTSRHASAWFSLYPYGGGGSGSYRALVPLLGSNHVHVPELPGRDRRHREPAHTSIGPLADDLWAQLSPQFDEHPVEDLVLYGYSLGAMMAFEMARRIEARGATPRALVVGGAASPERWDQSGVADLSDADFLVRWRRLGIAPAEVLDDEWMVALFMSVWRADSRLAESIGPRDDVSLNCPVIAVAGDRDPLAGPLDVEGWARLGGAGSSGTVIRGDHGTLVANPVQAARLLWRGAVGPVDAC